MKPAPFDYLRASSVGEAIAALAAANGNARVIAGGQTLGPMLNFRLATPALLIDISGIAALKHLEQRSDWLVLGSGITHAAIEDREDTTPIGQLLSYVASTIAYRAIRNRGTIGGSLAHADPAADWITTMTLLNARLTISAASGRRRVEMCDFMTGVFTTAIASDEILESIEIPMTSPIARWGYYKVCRKVGEFPDAVGAVLFDPQHGVSRIVVGALDGPPIALAALSERIARDGVSAATPEVIVEAMRGAAPELEPIDLRIHAAAVRRAIHQAVSL